MASAKVEVTASTERPMATRPWNSAVSFDARVR
jgi:hypothetical protein